MIRGRADLAVTRKLVRVKRTCVTSPMCMKLLHKGGRKECAGARDARLVSFSFSVSTQGKRTQGNRVCGRDESKEKCNMSDRFGGG